MASSRRCVGERTSQFEPGAGQLEGPLQPGPSAERHLQVGGGCVEVAAPHRHSTGRTGGHCREQLVVHRRRDLGQAAGGGRTAVDVARSQMRVDEQVQSRDEMRPVLLEAMEAVLEAAAGGWRVATSQQQRRHRQRLVRFGVDALAEMGQQLIGFLEATLTDPQGGQTGQRLGVQARAGTVGDPQTDDQLALGVVPATLGRQHAPVVDAALGVQERTAVGGHELVGHLAPLRRPLHVAGQLAGVQHVAAGVHDGVQRRALTGQRGGHRLIDQREPVAGFALGDPDQPEL